MDANEMIAESQRWRAREASIDRLTTIAAALVTGRSVGTLGRDAVRDVVIVSRELLSEIEKQVVNG
jgi:hypothetical protein